MKFTLENFKPINKATIKVKDLTLIFGDNNTGKTYIAYALYGLLKLINSLNINILSDEKMDELLTKNEINIDKKSLDIKKILADVADKYAENMVSAVFSNSADITPKILIENIKLSSQEQNITLTVGKSKVIIQSNKDKFNISIAHKEESSIHILFYELNKELLRLLFDTPTVFISVAERLGISLFQKDLDLNINTLVDHIKKSKEADRLNPFDLIRDYSSRYAMPVKENIDFMRGIETIQKEKTVLKVDLSSHIKQMMGGELKHNGTEIIFSNGRKKQNKMDIPLHLTSASVRALSNLYFFLKHKAKAGDLIIIDEPESHLSLAKQRLLAKLIADCINNGLKIMLTTHSDTLVVELNNLMMLNSEFDDKTRFMKSHKYEHNHIINPECVSAYITKKGGVVVCEIDKYGIEVSSMDEAIDALNKVNDGLLARI